jgi:RNA polymerase sigma-70 factor (ECF subfamily)
MATQDSGHQRTANPTDDALVARAQAREFEAFEELVGRHQERIYRLAARMTGSQSDAQEVVQEALLSAWKNLPSFEGKAQFGSWLYRITANEALMLLRSRRRHPEVSVDEVGAAVVDEATRQALTRYGAGIDWSRRPDDQFQSNELQRHIQAAVDALPETSRQVFIIRDVEGLSTEETADVLGLSVPAVKTRLHRARLALRDAISGYFTKG